MGNEAKILYGTVVAEEIKSDIAKKVAQYKAELGRVPGLAVIVVGDDPASATYVASKEKMAIAMGFRSIVERLPENTSEEFLLKLIERFNADSAINGILVQLPLPKHINEFAVSLAIDPFKDVDGLHPVNVGLLQLGMPAFIPCTPYGVMVLLDKGGVDIAGKNAVVIGRSNIVGKPMAALLTGANATVTVCHSKTKDLKAICKAADIIVAAIGRPKMIDGEYVKDGAVVIDVGINRVDGKLCGDVDLDSVIDRVSLITPVPKGVGPMTLAMLMQNTLQSFERQQGRN